MSYVGLIQRAAGCREEAVAVPAGCTLGDLLERLVMRHGGELAERLLPNGEPPPHATILVNGRNAEGLGGLAASLETDATQVEIVLLGPPLMGG